MPVLFCERCGKDTEWVYLGSEAVYCRSCGWQMSYQDFRAYRSRVLKAEFEKFLEEERKKDWLEATFEEFEGLVQQNERLAEEIHKRNMKQIRKFANRVSKKRRKLVLGAYPV
jgi:hypothetical protein